MHGTNKLSINCSRKHAGNSRRADCTNDLRALLRMITDTVIQFIDSLQQLELSIEKINIMVFEERKKFSEFCYLFQTLLLFALFQTKVFYVSREYIYTFAVIE